MPRIACAFVPRFELAIRARRAPELWVRLLAIAEVTRPKTVLLSLTPAAEARKLREGMLLNEALALVPDLEIIPPEPPLIREAEAEILAALGMLSPSLDSDGLGAFYLTLAGLDRLYADETAFAEQVRRCLRELGFNSGVGIADGPLASRVAAGRTTSVTVVHPGDDTRMLVGVPLDGFGLPAPAIAWLEMLGIREAWQLAQLPAGTLSMRLPVEGPRIERLCRGEMPTAWPSAAKLPMKTEEVTLDLDGPTSELEPLLFLFKALLDRLLGRVAILHHALTTLLIEAKLDDRSRVQHRLTAARPTIDGRQWMDLARLWLSSSPFKSDVAGFRLIAERTEVAEDRQLLLLHRRDDQAREALLLAVKRLAAAYGEDAVVQAELVDTYLPEARLRWRPFGAEGPDAVPAKLPESRLLPALRFCSPPEPVRWGDSLLQHQSGQEVRVLRRAGPCRVSGHWWERSFDRSYFWLHGMNEHLWIFRDESDGAVYLHAIAD